MKMTKIAENGFIRHRRSAWIFFGLVIFFCTALAASKEDRASRDTLAIIGNRVITANTFIKLFNEKLVKIGLRDNSNARLGYLLNLVDDEVLIHRAKQEKLDRTGKAIRKKRSIVIQELLNAYLEKHISRKDLVTENDLRDLFVKMNRKIKVSHIYAKTIKTADSLFHQLSQGASFNEIAKRTFTDPELKEHAGSLGYISIDEMDPEFEKTAFEMQIGEISHPIKTVQGYSIIRVEDIKENPFVTESEYAKSRERLRGFAQKRKYEELVKQWTRALRSKLHLRFNTSWVNKLYMMSQEYSTGYMLENTSLMLNHFELRETVVTSSLGKWNVEEVISELSKTGDWQRSWIHTEENLEDFIAGLVLQKHLVREARKEKLDRAPSFRMKVQNAFETYLLSTLEDRIRDQITIPSDSLYSYYIKHKDDFIIPEEMRISAILVDDALRQDSVRRQLEHGIPFSESAKQYSIQTATAERGGDLGYFRRKDLGDIGGKIFSLKTGEWTGPLVEDNKYLFVKCTDQKEAIQRSFEESKREIEDVLISMTWIDSRHEYVESLKKKITWRVFPEKLQAMALH